MNPFDAARDRIRAQFEPQPEVTDCTGIILGNQDIGCPEWLPTHVNPSATNLPSVSLVDWTEYYAEMFRAD